MSNVIDFEAWKLKLHKKTIDNYNKIAQQKGYLSLEDQYEVFGRHYSLDIWEDCAVELIKVLYDDTLPSYKFEECVSCGDPIRPNRFFSVCEKCSETS